MPLLTQQQQPPTSQQQQQESEFSLEIRETSLGGKPWAWMLWRQVPGESGRDILACEMGKATKAEAKQAWRDFQKIVADATMTVVRKQETPDEESSPP